MIPISTDRPIRRTPLVNYTLIAINVAIAVSASASTSLREWLILHWVLQPDTHFGGLLQGQALPADVISSLQSSHRVWQFVTHQFIHSDLFGEGPWHLAGNMVFLWVFGNAVEDRLGRWGYLLFYLTAGILAGLAQLVISPAPSLGASGAIAGVTGAFLAFFPLTRVRLLFWFLIITTYELPALWVILFSFACDVFFQLRGYEQVAYFAHIGGTIFGFLFAMSLLWIRVLPREPYDMMTMYSQWRRRQEFAAMADRGFDPWRAQRGAPNQKTPLMKPAASALPDAALALRTQVSEALSRQDRPAALKAYRALTAQHEEAAVFNRDQQVEIGNALFAEEDYAQAAMAYRAYLARYPTAPRIEQVQLILGLILTRYLRRAEEARVLLTQAAGKLRSADDKALAQTLLAELGAPGPAEDQTRIQG